MLLRWEVAAVLSNRINRKHLFWFLPVAALVISVLLLQGVFSRKQTSFREISPYEGVLDITEEDFSDEVVNVQNNWDFYPGVLYDSADFASGNVGEKEAPEVSSSDFSYGTYRLLIRAQPNQYYTICGFSVAFGAKIIPLLVVSSFSNIFTITLSPNGFNIKITSFICFFMYMLV